MRIHQHLRAFVRAGSGPAVLLLHGVGQSCGTWDRVLPCLARHFTVVAPDLLGHGRSDKPRADYSLGGYANAMRDLLSVVGIERATVIGHSFGGGVAMQFAYQYPERCERVVLVGSGGLGPEVTPLLRALTLPGASWALAGGATAPVRRLGRLAWQVARLVPGVAQGRRAPLLRDLPEILAMLEQWVDPAARQAFLHLLRAVIDHQGQVVTMLDRAYLAEVMPVLLVWGRGDGVIPVAHAHAGAAALPGSELVILDDAGHFPHRDQPAAFVRAVEDFMARRPPAAYDLGAFRGLLSSGGSARAGESAGAAPLSSAEGPTARQ